MAFNGSGAFARLFSWRTDRANGVDIDSTRMDQEMDGMADGLSNCMTRDGQSTIIGDIPFNNQKITGLADAAAATDAMNRQSSDARYTPRVSTKAANYTLLAADIGSLIVGTGTWTLTLLAAATAGNGFSLQIRNAGSGVITIDPDSAELINGAATKTVQPGQDLRVVCDGTSWRVLGDDPTSLATNGYIKLQGGLIIQWGADAGGASLDHDVIFPIPFPNACFSVAASLETAGVTAGTIFAGVMVAALTTTKFYAMPRVQVGDSSAVSAAGFRWVAIGY